MFLDKAQEVTAPSCFAAAVAFFKPGHLVGVSLLAFICWLLSNSTVKALRYEDLLSNFQANTILMKAIIQGFSLPYLLFYVLTPFIKGSGKYNLGI